MTVAIFSLLVGILAMLASGTAYGTFFTSVAVLIAGAALYISAAKKIGIARAGTRLTKAFVFAGFAMSVISLILSM